MRPPKWRETAITQTSDNHNVWEVWTDDPYWQRRLDRIAEGRPFGSGIAYTLRADQVLLRKGKPKRTVKVESIQNLKRGSDFVLTDFSPKETPDSIGTFDTSNQSLVCLDLEACPRCGSGGYGPDVDGDLVCPDCLYVVKGGAA